MAGGKGIRYSGTTVKDTWTKPRVGGGIGEVGGDGWGGKQWWEVNAENLLEQ